MVMPADGTKLKELFCRLFGGLLTEDPIEIPENRIPKPDPGYAGRRRRRKQL